MLLVILACAAAFAQPRIDSISPSQGPIAGGTILTINGVNFSGAAVKFDSASVAALSQSDSEVRLQMPKHDNGYALIQIGSAATEFLYLPPKLEDLPPGYITTVAGVGNYLRVEQAATRSMVLPWGVTVTFNGDIYFAQAQRNLVLRVKADGILQRVAGSLRSADIGSLGDDGSALNAYIGFPRSVALDRAGNVYVGDSRARVRKIDAVTGLITTVAGNGTAGFSGDGGPATQALLTQPTHLAAVRMDRSTSSTTMYAFGESRRMESSPPSPGMAPLARVETAVSLSTPH